MVNLLVLVLAPQLIAAVAIQARQSVTCDFSTAANNGDTCSSFAAGWGLTTATFQSLNPGVTCPNLVGGQDYCVIGEVSTSPTTTSTSSKPTTTSKTTATAVTTTTTSKAAATTSSGPSPTQSGLISTCNKFYQVISGDSCAKIETQYGVPAASFSSWNPSIDSACSNLFLGYYVCVGVPGFTATTTKPATTTAANSAPSPTQPGLATNCNNFYQVKSGDGCYAIEQAKGISAAQFQTWNPAIDSSCSNLFLGYYVCVGVTGSTPTPTPTPAPSGPSPQMPDTVSYCKTYYQVQSGDGCYAIEQAKGISAANFQKWNPYVDAACSNLFLGYYICIGV